MLRAVTGAYAYNLRKEPVFDAGMSQSSGILRKDASRAPVAMASTAIRAASGSARTAPSSL
ncbi:MAG: hypothetical protein JF606_24990 [Burkholderiales bacterium]|nr:hypothetical protein [Burkholderiales bacterium]